MEPRRRGQKRYDPDFESFSESESSESSDFERKRKSRKNRRGQDSGYGDKARVTRSHSRDRTDEVRKKGTLGGPMPISLAPKEFTDKSDLEHDPAGNPCRFVPFEEIRERVLLPDTYLNSEETGVTTLLPEFNPEQRMDLSYFGFKSELEKTELASIHDMSDSALTTALESVEEELQRLPELEALDDTGMIAIPGYATNLTDSIAINGDVKTFPWHELGKVQKFDVILMDPPWVIARANVTRGVNIEYDQMEVSEIAKIPIHHVQERGYMFMWVIASQLSNGILMLKKWGYKLVSVINWIKVSRYGKYMPSHGYYVQHNKETLIIGLKGEPPEEMNKEEFQSCVIQTREVRQSHKPEELYEMIEKMFPGQMYLEIFARPHNLRSGWVSFGIELPT